MTEPLAHDTTQVLLDPASISRGLRRIAGEIIERSAGTEGLVLIAVRRGGVLIAREIRSWILNLEGSQVPMGSVDITLYRDDAPTALPNPRIGPSQIPSRLDGTRVVLIDDVLYTGRTVRAAIDALIDYGRPRRIELAVLVDRSGRELPIQADYAVRRVEIGPKQRIDVLEDSRGLHAVVRPASAPSELPPP